MTDYYDKFMRVWMKEQTSGDHRFVCDACLETHVYTTHEQMVDAAKDHIVTYHIDWRVEQTTAWGS